MRITVLGSGTSSGVPEIGCHCAVCRSKDVRDQRLRASVLVEDQGEVVLIDCGPDFRRQMLTYAPAAPTSLLVTHHHYDHVGGLDDLRPLTRKSAFQVYASATCGKILQQHYPYMFAQNKYPGVPDIELHSIGRSNFYIGKLQVTSIQLYHHRLPILGYRIGDFAYITDFTFIDDEEKAKLKGLRVLIIEALRHDPHIAHIHLSAAIELCGELQPLQVFFTHMSHQMGLHEEVNMGLPKGMALAYDGLQIEF